VAYVILCPNFIFATCELRSVYVTPFSAPHTFRRSVRQHRGRIPTPLDGMSHGFSLSFRTEFCSCSERTTSSRRHLLLRKRSTTLTPAFRGVRGAPCDGWAGASSSRPSEAERQRVSLCLIYPTISNDRGSSQWSMYSSLFGTQSGLKELAYAKKYILYAEKYRFTQHYSRLAQQRVRGRELKSDVGHHHTRDWSDIPCLWRFSITRRPTHKTLVLTHTVLKAPIAISAGSTSVLWSKSLTAILSFWLPGCRILRVLIGMRTGGIVQDEDVGAVTTDSL
jgi:hypothetical protein